MFTHFSKYPNCDLCPMTQTTRARCKSRRLQGADLTALRISFGDLPAISEAPNLDLDDEPRNEHRNALSVEDGFSYWLQSCPLDQDAAETASLWRKFSLPFQKPGIIYADNSREFIKACQDLQWAHDTKTPHRSEYNGTADRAVRSRNTEEEQWRWFKVTFLQTRRTVRWNVTGTCGASATEWPMARPQTRTYLV